MQRHKSINLYLPGLLVERLEECLQEHPPTWRYKMDYFHSLIHHITMKELWWKNRKEEYYPIDMQMLKSASVSNISRYIKYLVDEDLLHRDNYIKGERPFHYKLNPVYLHGVKKVQIEPGSNAFKKLRESWDLERHNVCRLDPYFKQMRKLFLKVDLDYTEAIRWINSQPDSGKRFRYYSALERFRDKRSRYFDRNDTNKRLDTNLTVLKKELREFLIGDWVSIDLANSQPFLLSQVLEDLFNGIWGLHTIHPILQPNNNIPLCSNFLNKDLVKWFGKQAINGIAKIPQNDTFSPSEELLKFQIACINGVFYEDFLDQFYIGDLDRDNVKEIMFPVLFSRNEVYRNYKRMVPYEKEKEQFAQVYPTISRVIKELKRKDHAKLAILLQQLESKVFIDTICPRLVEEGIVPLTIHDSIIVKVKQSERAVDVCQEVFKKGFGVIPTFHVKHLKTEGYDEARSNSDGEKSICQAVEREEQGEGFRLSA